MVAIDLGLSVKWANMNIGAEQCSDAGYFFAWGDISPASTFNISNLSRQLKLMPSDNLLKLSPKNDAAFHLLGNSWRLPTRNEAIELIEKCEIEIANFNGVYGTKVSSSNGNYIFLPNTGRIEENKLLDVERLYYWFSTSLGDLDADGLGGYRGDLRWYHSYRQYIGRCIRPVYDSM